MALNPNIGVSHNKAFTNNVSSKGDIEEAAIKFEQLFIKKMLSSSRSTLPGDHLLGSNDQRKIMLDMQDDAIANELAASKSFGIAKLLIQQAQLGN